MEVAKMSKEFKEGFSKGIGLTTGVLAIPVAGLLLFGVYRVLRNPVRGLFYDLFRSEEMDKYSDCMEKRWDRFQERSELFEKRDYDDMPPIIDCEKPTRKWKWQPKK